MGMDFFSDANIIVVFLSTFNTLFILIYIESGAQPFTWERLFRLLLYYTYIFHTTKRILQYMHYDSFITSEIVSLDNNTILFCVRFFFM